MATRSMAAAAPQRSTLDRLSTSGKVALGALFVVLFAALYYVGFYGDISREVDSAKSREASLGADLTKANASKEAYQKDLDEKTHREAHVLELKKALPDEAEMPSFLSQLQGMASISGITLTSWNPQEEVVADYYVRVPLKIAFTGKYHQILHFIDLAGHLDRITNIEDIKLKNPKVDGDEVTVEGECMAIGFRSVKPGETPGKKRGAR